MGCRWGERVLASGLPGRVCLKGRRTLGGFSWVLAGSVVLGLILGFLSPFSSRICQLLLEGLGTCVSVWLYLCLFS